jgi:hypothetical protein
MLAAPLQIRVGAAFNQAVAAGQTALTRVGDEYVRQLNQEAKRCDELTVVQRPSLVPEPDASGEPTDG